MSRIAKDLAALTTMTPAQLKERWVEVVGPVVPALPAPLVCRLLAYRLQERKFGSLSATVVRELERAAQGNPQPSSRRSVPLTPGARLVREWNGQTISVEVRVDGFWWREQTWRSLSEIAGEVTGTHWSGPRFFGLIQRG
ncbi:DUF2924 domain-containing protein [Novosphingobium sp. Gsoil 351]|uniref:DUF2924 domain-containing protein n=1 Tax=Novosphingobium sp. Gsoil 351 TaxID=2675225 RepID=UPI0012B45C45|nr:DUF2924 domain-containing protein [Novosphingobium sp. Gsoil 351]QGN55450.1 DUF2924 domain-containing protein [Novosphingobium sp. Gsoil 351]